MSGAVPKTEYALLIAPSTGTIAMASSQAGDQVQIASPPATCAERSFRTGRHMGTSSEAAATPPWQVLRPVPDQVALQAIRVKPLEANT